MKQEANDLELKRADVAIQLSKLNTMQGDLASRKSLQDKRVAAVDKMLENDFTE
jgi:hypothetical protein